MNTKTFIAPQQHDAPNAHYGHRKRLCWDDNGGLFC